ncbi:hypothetical protein ABHI18_003095 [Aspergillus niger]
MAGAEIQSTGGGMSEATSATDELRIISPIASAKSSSSSA